jgi:hypothetical protein
VVLDCMYMYARIRSCRRGTRFSMLGPCCIQTRAFGAVDSCVRIRIVVVRVGVGFTMIEHKHEKCTLKCVGPMEQLYLGDFWYSVVCYDVSHVCIYATRRFIKILSYGRIIVKNSQHNNQIGSNDSARPTIL